MIPPWQSEGKETVPAMKPVAKSASSSKNLIGCCGAYCKTCPAFADAHCRGCKSGYESGERDIRKARCKMKLCCIRERKLETCADCRKYGSCKTIHGFYGKKGFKYGKYRQSMEFIRKNGYSEFMRLADKWKCAYGKLAQKG